jgi:lipooligosaccharide transport system permease protein
MFLFSGTFFPISALPWWAQKMSLLFPLYHLVELMRFLSLGRLESNPWISVGYLVVFSLIFLVLSLRAMKRRLIQ